MSTNENAVLKDELINDMMAKGIWPIKVLFSEYRDYDKHGNCVHIIDTYGREKCQIYDDTNNHIIKKFYLTDGKVTRTVGYLYDKELRRLRQEIDSARGLFKYSYSSDGLTTTIEGNKEPIKYTRMLQHDVDGHILLEEIHNITNSRDNQSEIHIIRHYKYDDEKKLILKVEDVSDSTPRLIKTEYIYDDLGRKTKVVKSTGAWKNFEYDEKDRVIKTVNNVGLEEIYNYYDDISVCHKSSNQTDGDEDWYLYNSNGDIIWRVQAKRKYIPKSEK